MTNEIVKPSAGVEDLNKFLKSRENILRSYCAKSMDPAVLIRLANYEFAKNTYMHGVSHASIYASLIAAAQLGLEPSGVRGEAYLVPFKGQCTLIPGYRGLIKLALQSTMVKSIDAQLVYQGDHFEVWMGTETKIVHRPDFVGGDKEIIAAYAVAELSTGGKVIEVMGRSELERIKKFAASQRGGKAGPAYNEWEDQMWRKAPIRRLCKRLPLGESFARAAMLDETEDPSALRTVIDLPSDAAFETTVDGAEVVPSHAPQSLAAKVAKAKEESR